MHYIAMIRIQNLIVLLQYKWVYLHQVAGPVRLNFSSLRAGEEICRSLQIISGPLQRVESGLSAKAEPL